MKSACESQVAYANSLLKARSGLLSSTEQDLFAVANAFVQAQQRRIEADYNLAKEWAPSEVAAHVSSVEEAFQAWGRIGQDAKAQALLVSMLGAKDRRAGKAKT